MIFVANFHHFEFYETKIGNTFFKSGKKIMKNSHFFKFKNDIKILL